MSTISNFANTSPAPGKMKIFYTASAAGSKVRAVTIRKASKSSSVAGAESINVTPSLQELNFIKTSVSASGDQSEFFPIVKSDRGNYFFITTQEFLVGTNPNDISGSNDRIVILDPNLQQSFSNSNFNPVISNATIPRPSRIRFDVDRISGQVHPSNIDAVRGTVTNTLTRLQISSSNGDVGPFDTGSVLIQQNGSGFTQNFYTLNFTSSLSFDADDFPLNVQITPGELEEVFGEPTIPNILSFKSASASLPSSLDYDVDYNLSISLYKTTNVGSLGLTLLHAQSLYKEDYISSSYDSTTINGLFRNIPAMDNGVKSLNTDGRLYIVYQLQIRTTRVGGGYVNTDRMTFTNPVSNTANTKTKNNLTLKVFKSTPEPYATRATVPDSNYTSTGYANARYRGTKTSASSFSGVSPAFGAKLFKGLPLEIPSEFNFAGGSGSLGGLFDVIADKAVSASADRLEDFFFNTEGDEPEASTEPVGTIASSSLAVAPYWHAAAGLGSSADTQFILDIEGGVQLEVGDVIAFNQTAGTTQALALNKERCIVTNIEPIARTNFIIEKPALGDINNKVPIQGLLRITVLRAQFGTTAATSHGRTVRVFRKRGSAIFGIEGSKAVGLSNKIVVLDAENIAANLAGSNTSEFKFVLTDERGNISNIFTTSAKSGSLERTT